MLNACECYKKIRSWFSAAKALEQVITICLRKKPIPPSENDEKGVVVSLTSKINSQLPKTAAYFEQLGSKKISEEVIYHFGVLRPNIYNGISLR